MITTSGRGTAKKLDTIATDSISKVDAALEKKSEKYKIGEEENGHSEHVILNHLTKMKMLCMSIGTKFDSDQNVFDLMECTSLHVQPRKRGLLYLNSLSVGTDKAISTIFMKVCEHLRSCSQPKW